MKALIPQSLKNQYHKAKAIYANTKYGFPARKLKVIGITGTDGKTTTTHLIYHLLKTAGFKVVAVSTVAAYIGDKKLETGFHVTTPSSSMLQKFLKDAVDGGYEYAVVESTSHGLDQNRLWGIPFYIGALTNITHEHLDYHGTYERYLEAKAKLFKETQFAILNHDDLSFNKIERKVHGKIITYGIKFNSDIKADHVKTTTDGVEFDAEGIHIKAPLFGEYNVSNMLAAMGVAEAIGISNDHIKEAFASFPGVPGRMEKVPNERGIDVYVDFAHTPNAIERLLSNLRPVVKGRIIAVFGSAGKRDTTKRPAMGKAAKQFADAVVLTAEDPRGESVEKICHEIMGENGFTEGKDVYIEPDRAQAIDFAINKLAQKGDVVVTLGKSHEKGMNIDGSGDKPWDEFKAVRAALSRNHES